MKKLFTLVCGLAMAFCANAAVSIEPNFVGWGKCTVDGQVITYPVAWDGAKIWMDEADWSDYDCLWVTLSESTCPFELDVEYGAESAPATVASAIAGSKIICAKLNQDYSDKILQFYLKAKEPGKLVVTGVYLGTEEEYEEALAGNKIQKTDLSLADLSSGWGSSTYDAATKTITIGEDWSGKGWWLDGANYADFDMVVVNFAEPTATNGEIVVEYNVGGDSGNSVASIAEGATSVTVDLGNNRDQVKQIYIKGPEGAKFVLASAYACTKDYTTGVKQIHAEKAAALSPIYNLAGQQVSKSYKGIVIQDGKKFVQK